MEGMCNALTSDADPDAEVRALKPVEQLGRKLHHAVPIALAYRAEADIVVKIHGAPW